MRNVALAVAMAIGLSGCATTYSANPSVGNSQSINYNKGIARIESNKQNSFARLSYVGSYKDRITFGLRVIYQGTVLQNVGTENITVTDSAGASMKVYSAGELIHEANAQASRRKLLTAVVAITGVVASVAASEETTTGTVNTPNGPVSYSQRTENPAVALAGSAASVGAGAAGFSAINQSRDSQISNIGSKYFSTSTLKNGDNAVGLFEVALPRQNKFPQEISVVVRVGTDTHEFKYAIVKSE